MAKRFRLGFTVGPIAGVSFPWDMLRYDACYPLNETDSHAIERTLGGKIPPAGTRVDLVHEGERSWKPTIDRWESFGWTVLDGPRKLAAL